MPNTARRRDPAKRSSRAGRDAALSREIRGVFDENFGVYGVRKVWRQLGREEIGGARCTAARLMRAMKLEGVVRGPPLRATRPDKALPCPHDRVNRAFHASAPNRLWVSDFTCVATWRGFALVIDTFARRIVGWRVSGRADAGFALDALEQALHDRKPFGGDRLAQHSDRGARHLWIKYKERLAEAGIDPSVGSPGDSYDNALAETVIGLVKTEVIRRSGPWRSIETVEFATLEWVDWFNTRRLLEPTGNIPPAEAEARHHAAPACQPMAASDSIQTASGKPGAVHFGIVGAYPRMEAPYRPDDPAAVTHSASSGPAAPRPAMASG